MNTALRLLSPLRLHAFAALLDFAGLAAMVLQALYWIPPMQADRRILVLVACAPLISLVVFALVPRRTMLGSDTATERRAIVVYGNLGFPVVFSLLTGLLVAVNGSFDSFAGFALLVAADGGRNLREALWHGLSGRKT
ncbi:MAG TPA: hypothetical protein VLG68_09565 [Gammaproteobacteria bacterium]|nr:hypothetical protein [Gammaproteobacteria bacterium]